MTTKQLLPVILAATVMITLAQDKKEAPPVTQMTKEDQYHLRAVNAELVTIQTQMNQFAEQLHAQDKVKERNELVTRLCGGAKIPMESCSADPDTGKVTEIKKTPSPTSK
jgi:hypothetical protein